MPHTDTRDKTETEHAHGEGNEKTVPMWIAVLLIILLSIGLVMGGVYILSLF